LIFLHGIYPKGSENHMAANSKRFPGIKWPRFKWPWSGAGGAPSNVLPFPTQRPAPVGTEEMLAESMQEAQQISDVHHSPADKVFMAAWSLFFYVAPVVVAYAAGRWIGDGYTGVNSSAGESQGIHIISLVGELALAGGAIIVAELIKRLANDKTAIRLLTVALAVFVASAIGSAMAQWFLILTNAKASGYDTSAQGFAMMLAFRVLMPVITDIFAMLYLGIYGRHSLKMKLAQLDERGEAFEKIHDRKLRMQEKEEKARRDKEDADRERESRRRREETLVKMETMYSEAALAQMEKALNPKIVDADDDNSRRQRRSF
jgi:hypothetical protein